MRAPPSTHPMMSCLLVVLAGCGRLGAAPGADSGPSASASAAPSEVAAASAPAATAQQLLPSIAHGAHGAQGPKMEDSPAVDKWVVARAAEAKEGRREIVSLPVSAVGGGATMPPMTIGVWMGAVVGTGDGLDVEWEPGAPKPAAEHTSLVQGYFTGTHHKTPDFGGPVFDLYGFHALRARPFAETDPMRADILLAGEEGARVLPPLTDDRRWLAIVDSLPVVEANVDVAAQSMRSKLAAAGFTDAEVIDSRQTADLFCCYRVVLAGRFATEAEAASAVKLAKAKKFQAYARKGW